MDAHKRRTVRIRRRHPARALALGVPTLVGLETFNVRPRAPRLPTGLTPLRCDERVSARPQSLGRARGWISAAVQNGPYDGLEGTTSMTRHAVRRGLPW